MSALAAYFQETSDTPSALADRLDCAVSTITRIARGERRPSVDLAGRIERETTGLVTATALLGLTSTVETGQPEPEPAL